MPFQKLELCDVIVRAARDAGYDTPTPIQTQAIPPIVDGRDLLGCAKTGTGKTAAFAMPILHRLNANLPQQVARRGKKQIRALVLSPTRELAAQIGESFRTYGKHTKIRTTVVFGGVSQSAQTRALQRGVDVLVATPGRLLDLCQQGFIDLSHVETLVLDEADHMLDMGFLPDVRRIIAKLPKKRQTLLFSATMPKEIRSLAEENLHEPVRISIAPKGSTADLVEQYLYFVGSGEKAQLLAQYLHTMPFGTALVFTRTKHGADTVVRKLGKLGVKAEAIHGNKSQAARQRTLANFKEGRVMVLVATDIAARGLDITGISYVFNYDLPDVPETYVHRIGRTGRAGESGHAIALCSNDQRKNLVAIQRQLGKKLPLGPELADMPEGIKPIQAEPRGNANGPRNGSGKPKRTTGRPGKTRPKKKPRPKSSGGGNGEATGRRRRQKSAT